MFLDQKELIAHAEWLWRTVTRYGVQAAVDRLIERIQHVGIDRFADEYASKEAIEAVIALYEVMYESVRDLPEDR